MTAEYPQCWACKNYIKIRNCKAFDSIPKDIWLNNISHTKPYNGDHSIQFSPKGGALK